MFAPVACCCKLGEWGFIWLSILFGLVVVHRILSEVVSNFPNSLDEVTMTVEPAGLRLRNYVDDFEGISPDLWYL